MERPKILVVDDDGSTRRALFILFSRRGWDVALASTVAEGLTLLADFGPRCLILDLNLPDGGGEVVLREVRRVYPRTKVAVCSASTNPTQLAIVQNLKPELMLCKPIDLAPLDDLCQLSLAS